MSKSSTKLCEVHLLLLPLFCRLTALSYAVHDGWLDDGDDDVEAGGGAWSLGQLNHVVLCILWQISIRQPLDPAGLSSSADSRITSSAKTKVVDVEESGAACSLSRR